MKPPAPPVFAIASFPQPARPRQQYYVEQLATHVSRFPGISVPHAHDFYLLLYVTRGRGTHTIDLLDYPVQPGSLFFMTPGQVHSWQLSDDAQGLIVFFDADFYLFRYPGSTLYEYPFFGSPNAPVLNLPPGEAEIYPLFERLLAESQSPFANQADVFRSYLHLSLELATRHYSAAPGRSAGLGAQQVRDFGRLLNEHFRTRHAVADYAALLHLTPNHLNAVCRRVLNKTASALIQERIVVEARRLLRHSALSVAQVADRLGFEDASYFGRYFRKHAGQTPETYRQNR
ncbi:AraC family transcriptional regulator [Hymenobacter persicinus]|uniref:Helix-turn-helix domain-containing protein n=1 Tax=Hymenobacter persicinus TaxID=2025506 RepID=A0A4Q5LCU1_9BACT|nr:helix-turn-helix transcriptional regulator [Hymenobacter persicinus]RYU79153.1 helix-turn-helix domain-containing protein [Hymenobacter persicinus]